MKVINFDTETGIYHFNINGLETEFHSHPAIELIYSTNEPFTIITDTEKYEGVYFGVINRNIKHQLIATDSELEIFMIEHHSEVILDFLTDREILLNDNVNTKTSPIDCAKMIQELTQKLNDKAIQHNYDERVWKVMQFLDHQDLEYQLKMKPLASLVNLSESRLSHLFKQNIGISIKKYLVWSRLRNTIKLHLRDDQDLFSSLIESGFYDQPHFSNSFKTMLGINPSKAYNSRTLQVPLDSDA